MNTLCNINWVQQYNLSCFVIKSHAFNDAAFSKDATNSALHVNCTPSATVTFVSKLYTGNISDKQIVSKSRFLYFIHPGNNVLADRGFLIRDVLAIREATLNIPPFSHGKQLSMHATTLTRRIARARVVVKWVIGRMKEFKLFFIIRKLNHYFFFIKRKLIQKFDICIIFFTFKIELTANNLTSSSL